MNEKQRPKSITILSILFFIFGIAGIIRGFYAGNDIVLIPIVSNLFSFLGLPSYGLFSFLLISIIFFLTAYGLWFLKKWAIVLAVIYAILLSLTIVMIPVSVFMIYVLLRKETRKAFSSSINL